MRPFLLALTLTSIAIPASAQSLGVSFLQTPPAPQPVSPQSPAPVPAILRPATSAFPPDVKLGFINLQTIAQQSAAGKAASVQLKAFQDSKASEIQVRNQTVKTLQDKQNAAALLSPAAAAQLQKDLERAQMDLQYAEQLAQKEYDDLQKDVMNAFSDKVAPVVESIRAEKGLWAVWAIDDSLAAVMPGLDLSMDVVKRLDAQK